MWAIAAKDIRAIRNSIQVWLPMLIVPLIMGAVMPAGLILGVRYSGAGDFAKMLESLTGALDGAITTLDSLEQQVVYLIVNYFCVPLFLLIPLMLSSTITANSFAAEKERKTLESLLFSPVDIPTLFAGKVLSAFLPAMAISLFCFVLYGVVVNVLAYPLFERLIFPTINWVILVLWTIPSIALFGIFINVIISARVKGFQEAYQMGGLVVLPVIVLVLGQALGAIAVNVWLLLWGGLVVFTIDVALLRFIKRHFDRNQLFESQVS
jgi:ABC-2 type transport system permease protein